MRKRLAAAGLILLAAGCSGSAPAVIDSAQLRPGELTSGSSDPDVAAVELAQAAFADPSRTYGRPAEAARAAAAMEYIAGALSTSPRWTSITAVTRQQLLQGRAEVRQAIGVVPGAPSQSVVDRLAAAAAALLAGDEARAVQELGPPVFDAPGQDVLARLAALPYLRIANAAADAAANELLAVAAGDGVAGP